MTKTSPPKDRLSDLIGKQNQIKIYWQEAHLKLKKIYRKIEKQCLDKDVPE